jgi:type VI secretion system secreted protein VgrG
MPTLDLTTAIGSPFDVRRFTVREGFSSLFSVELVGLADDHTVDLDQVVGQAVTFRIEATEKRHVQGKRSWSGVCQYIEQVEGMLPSRHAHRPQSTYRLRLVPRLWLLGQRINSRIFQRLSIPDIVDALLEDWSIAPKWKIDRGSYPKLEYKSQYAETDLQFFLRLLEEAGISFLLDDTSGDTELLLVDQPTSAPLRDHGVVRFEHEPNAADEREHVTKLHLAHDVRPGARMLIDYDMRAPATKLRGEAKKATDPESRYEHMLYRTGAFHVEGKGGDTPTADDKGAYRHSPTYGKKVAQIGLDGVRTGRRIVDFATNVLGLSPGTHFIAEGHPHEALVETLMVHDFAIDGDDVGELHMSARAVFVKEPFRPAPKTDKPKVFGAQSATVVGPAGQEIHVDELGRVRVKFPWDRDPKQDDDSSVWMRVNQGWSGVGFGMINIPRIGQEVLVGFLDGDVDDPIVMGRVFNALNPVPYKLPDRKTISGWKTHSSPTNGGYNEIQLEDKADKELIYIRAQRDEHHLVQRNTVHRIEKNHWRTVLENQHFIVKKTKKEWVVEDDHLHVQGGRMQKIDKSTSLTVGSDQDEKIGNKHALEAGKEIHLKAGKDVVVEAGSSLTIKGPGGHLRIHAGGIDIVGTLVKINSGGSPGSGSGATPIEPKDAEEAFPKDNSEDIED